MTAQDAVRMIFRTMDSPAFDKEKMIDRINDRLDMLGMNPRQASMLATGKPDLVRKIPKMKTAPAAPVMQALADTLATSADWLLGYTDDPTPPPHRAPAAQQEVREASLGYRAPATMPKDVPVYGTTAGGLFHAPDGDMEISTIHSGETIDWLRRPPSLAGRKDIFALFVENDSMSPRFEPGDAVYVDPKRPPAPMDYVIVQLVNGNGHDGGDHCIGSLIKRLVRRTAQAVVVEQFNPQIQLTIDRANIRAVMRVIPNNELFGI